MLCRFWLFTLLVACTACSSGTAPAGNPLGIPARWITPSVQAQLDPDGRLTRDYVSLNTGPGLHADQAEQLVDEFTRSIASQGGNLAATLIREHGAAIDFARLIRCERTTYLRSSFAPSASDVPPSVTNVIGGIFAFLYCQAQTPTVVVFLSAETQGRDGSSIGFSNGLAAIGVPVGATAQPRPPEVIVEAVARALGTRVSALPEARSDLYAIGPTSGRGERPSGVLWRLQLERPIAVRRLQSGTVDTITEAFASAGFSALPILRPLAPTASALLPFWVPTVAGSRGEVLDSVLVQPVSPIGFEEIVPIIAP